MDSWGLGVDDYIVIIAFIFVLSIMRLADGKIDAEPSSLKLSDLPWRSFLYSKRRIELAGGREFVRRLWELLAKWIIMSITVTIVMAYFIEWLLIAVGISTGQFPLSSCLATICYVYFVRSTHKFTHSQRRRAPKSVVEGTSRTAKPFSKFPRRRKASEDGKGRYIFAALFYYEVLLWALEYGIAEKILGPIYDQFQKHVSVLTNASAQVLYKKFGLDTVARYFDWLRSVQAIPLPLQIEIQDRLVNVRTRSFERACIILIGLMGRRGYFALENELTHFKQEVLPRLGSESDARCSARECLDQEIEGHCNFSNIKIRLLVTEISISGKGIYAISNRYIPEGQTLTLTLYEAVREGVVKHTEVKDYNGRLKWGIGIEVEGGIPEHLIPNGTGR